MKHMLYCALVLISVVPLSARESNQTGLLLSLRAEKQAAYDKVAAETAAVSDSADLVPLLQPIRIAFALNPDAADAADASIDTYVLLQDELGMPAEALTEIIDAVQGIAVAQHAAREVQEYFEHVGRLPIDPPRADDVRAWRFLFAEDVKSRLLATFARTGDSFPVAVHDFAEELARIDSATAEDIRLIADYLQERSAIREAALTWLAESLSIEAPFAFQPNEAPLSGFELGVLMQEHPAAAAAVAVLRRRVDGDGSEFRFLTNALRVALRYDLQTTRPAVSDDGADPVVSPLLSPEDMDQYRRRASGIIHAVEDFSMQQGRSWRSDPRQRIEIMGSMLAQFRLNAEHSVYEVVQDSVNEWIDGARILAARRELLSAGGFPIIVLLVESESASERLVQARNTWLQQQDAVTADDAGYSPSEWFAMHGLVVLQLDHDDPRWHAEADELALPAADLVAATADAVMYRSMFDDAFSSIAVADAAVRIAGLTSVWLEQRLQNLLWEAELAHPAAFNRKRQLTMYTRQLKAVLSQLDDCQDCLPELFGNSELALQADSWSSWLAGLEGSVAQVEIEVFNQ